MFNTRSIVALFTAIVITLVSACSTNDLRQYQINGVPLAPENMSYSAKGISSGGSAGYMDDDIGTTLVILTIFVIIPWYAVYKSVAD